MKFSKLIVITIIFMNVVFTGIILYMFWVKGMEPSVLVGAWYAFTTGELWALSNITKAKKGREGEKDWKK